MPRRKSAVKSKHVPRPRSTTTLGLVDIHFHGAFGIDVMQADSRDLDRLSAELWKNGIAGFCPTTLTADRDALLAAVERLGNWTRSGSAPGAVPLGLHLEGPFLNPDARGAHPLEQLRPLSPWKNALEEFEVLRKASKDTVRLITLAPELLTPAELQKAVRWAKTHAVRLSLGHSRATEAQARAALDAGIGNITHAWNALSFHHRDPGALGAAVGREDTFIEVIIDGIHVAPTAIRWLCQLHGHERTCFISDAAPAAGLKEKDQWVPFGSLRTHCEGGVCRLPGGTLAGGGQLLTETYRRWLGQEAKSREISPSALLKASIASVTTAPLAALGLPPRALGQKRVQWRFTPSPSLEPKGNSR